MKRYAKFGYAAPFCFRVILEKPQGGGQNDPPPATRAKVKRSKTQNFKNPRIHLFKYYLLCRFLAIRFTNVFLTNFQTFIFFALKSREVTSQNRLYLNVLPESDFSFTRRRRSDVRRVMPSFMSISARVQELFRKNRGGVISLPPPPGG